MAEHAVPAAIELVRACGAEVLALSVAVPENVFRSIEAATAQAMLSYYPAEAMDGCRAGAPQNGMRRKSWWRIALGRNAARPSCSAGR